MKLVSQCIKECMTRGIILQSHYTKSDEWKQYEGAYVLDPERGVYDGCSIVDFQSLYPSIIIAYNICPSTYIARPWRKQRPFSKAAYYSDTLCLSENSFHEISVYDKTTHYFKKEPVGLLPGMIKQILG